MIRRKVILEIKNRSEKNTVQAEFDESSIVEWLERRERNIPFFGTFADKLTITYEEEME